MQVEKSAKNKRTKSIEKWQDNLLVLPLPPSLNQTYKIGKGRFYKNKEAKEWEREAGWEIKKQWKKKPLRGRIYLCVWWFFSRERDIGSGMKILEDLLQTQQVYLNDNQIYHEHIYKDFDIVSPRVEVEVVELA